jgi:hypothetical protein
MRHNQRKKAIKTVRSVRLTLRTSVNLEEECHDKGIFPGQRVAGKRDKIPHGFDDQGQRCSNPDLLHNSVQ